MVILENIDIDIDIDKAILQISISIKYRIDSNLAYRTGLHKPECLVHQKEYLFLANQSLWGYNAAFIHHSFKVSVIKLQFILQSFQKYNSQYEIGTSGNRSTNLSRYSQWYLLRYSQTISGEVVNNLYHKDGKSSEPHTFSEQVEKLVVKFKTWFAIKFLFFYICR